MKRIRVDYNNSAESQQALANHDDDSGEVKASFSTIGILFLALICGFRMFAVDNKSLRNNENLSQVVFKEFPGGVKTNTTATTAAMGESFNIASASLITNHSTSAISVSSHTQSSSLLRGEANVVPTTPEHDSRNSTMELNITDPITLANDTTVKQLEDHLDERREHFKALKKRPVIGIIEIHANGTFTVINAPEKDFVHIEVIRNMKGRFQNAVKEYGEFPPSTFIDLDTVDFPAVQEISLSCHNIRSQFCCMSGLPMVGVSGNPCCECSLPLPLHDNQAESALQGFLRFQDPFNWTEKIDRAVWHGSSTGYAIRAVWVSKEFNYTEPYKHMDTPRRRIVKWATRPEAQGLLDASFKKKNWEEIVKYKYIVSVAGNSYAGILKPALLSNSCVLRQDAVSREWYEDEMTPWVHYVPVEFDLSDLFEKIQWAKDHDEECQKIAQEGKKFALEHLSNSAVNKFMYDAIHDAYKKQNDEHVS